MSNSAADTAGVGVPMRRSPYRQAGFTLVEVAVATALALMTLMFATSSLLSSQHSREASEDELDAAATLERAAATLRSLGVTAAFQAYAPNGIGDPYPAPGSGGGAPLLTLGLSDDLDPSLPAQVVVRFFTNETVFDPAFGLPRDLDRDGLATNTNTAQLGGNGQLLATILPFTLTLNYRGTDGGNRSLVWQGFLTTGT